MRHRENHVDREMKSFNTKGQTNEDEACAPGFVGHHDRLYDSAQVIVLRRSYETFKDGALRNFRKRLQDDSLLFRGLALSTFQIPRTMIGS